MRKGIVAIVICFSLLLVACSNYQETLDYGVFLGCEQENLASRTKGYRLVVVDGQDIDAEHVALLHEAGAEVYGYLNIGALEDWRDYYEDYKQLVLAEYEGWQGEYWVDVSSSDWTDLILDQAQELKDKGFDVFFLDNADVYYLYETEEIYDGLVAILEGLAGYDMDLVINGGDVFVTRLIEDGQGKLIDAINQEDAFSDEAYYLPYLETVHKEGIAVFLIEYTTDQKKIRRIEDYCEKHNYRFYITDSTELK